MQKKAKLHFSVHSSEKCWVMLKTMNFFENNQNLPISRCGKLKKEKYTIPIFDIKCCINNSKSAQKDIYMMWKIQKMSAKKCSVDFV